MSRRAAVFRWDDLPLDRVTEMISRKTIPAAGETLAQVYLKKGALVPLHSHAGAQLTYVLDGALRAVIDGETVTVRDGDVLHVPAAVPHQIEALDDTFVLDVRGT